jgi:GCN5-like protein 1 (GCN5L1)
VTGPGSPFSYWLVMFSAVVREHKVAEAQHIRRLERARNDVVSSIDKMTMKLLSGANSGVQHVHSQQARMEAEAKKYQHETTRFAKQTHKWLTLYKEFNDSIKV